MAKTSVTFLDSPWGDVLAGTDRGNLAKKHSASSHFGGIPVVVRVHAASETPVMAVSRSCGEQVEAPLARAVAPGSRVRDRHRRDQCAMAAVRSIDLEPGDPE